MRQIAFFIPDLQGGGAEKAVVNLLKEMVKRDIRPDLVLVNAAGVYLKDVPEQVRIINLHKKRSLYAIFSLSRYLRRNRPSVLISHLSHTNTIALLAKKMAGVSVPLVLVEHAILPGGLSFPGKQWFLQSLMKKIYPSASRIVAVSENTARNIETRLGLAAGKVQHIYNPVVNEELFEKANLPLSHPWFEKKGIPVFLGVGRLEPQKDFTMLLEAFARVRKERPARLIILGEGKLRRELEEHINNLGIEQDVCMPGFAENPFAYMAHCHAFVLSSRWEGLSNVLIEAMACGCPVISTDCPEGPAEVLEAGKYGLLVPVGNCMALAEAMIQSLYSPVSREALVQRAAFFSSEKAVNAYLSLLAEINH